MYPAPYRKNPLEPPGAVLLAVAGISVGVLAGAFRGRALQRRKGRRALAVIPVGPNIPGRENFPQGAAVVLSTPESPGLDKPAVVALWPSSADYAEVYPLARQWADVFARTLGDVEMVGLPPGFL